MYKKRIVRDFREHKIQYISFFILISLSVMVIVGFNRAMDSYVKTVEGFFEENKVQDGQFSLLHKLSKRKELYLEKKYQLKIQEIESTDVDFLIDAEGNSVEKEKDIILRVFSYDREIDSFRLLSGTWPKNNLEVAIDPKFAQAQGFRIGDEIIINSRRFTITGFGITPDYIYTIRNVTDMSVSPETFGVAYIGKKDMHKIRRTKSSETDYCFKGKGGDYEELRNELQKDFSMLAFVLKKDNPRIIQVFDDANAPRQVSLVIGLLLVLMVAFVISISIANTIDSESKTIGIFYAQGFRKHELLTYYMFLPVFIGVISTFAGGLAGVAISRPLLSVEAEYTTPEILMKSSPLLILLGIVLPIALTAGVSYYFISGRLNRTPLSLLRGDQKLKMPGKTENRISRMRIPFILRFRMKAIVRDKGSITAMFFGITLSVYILFVAMYLKDSAEHFVTVLRQSMPFESIYTFYNKSDLDKYSALGERTAIKEMRFDDGEKMRKVFLQGIEEGSEIFKIPELDSLGENEVIISVTMSRKFGLEKGDRITLFGDEEYKEYELFIAGIAPYDYGQYLYTTERGYNKILNLRGNQKYSLLTRKSFDIPTEKLIAAIHKGQLINSLKDILHMIRVLSAIMLWIGGAILVCIIVMLTQMNIEKDRNNISMVKIFGYRKEETKMLYLSGNLWILLFGGICAIPLGYYTTKMVYDGIMDNLQQYFLPYIYPLSLITAFAVIVIGYKASMYLLVKILEKIPLTEAIKNRE